MQDKVYFIVEKHRKIWGNTLGGKLCFTDVYNVYRQPNYHFEYEASTLAAAKSYIDFLLTGNKSSEVVYDSRKPDEN